MIADPRHFDFSHERKRKARKAAAKTAKRKALEQAALLQKQKAEKVRQHELHEKDVQVCMIAIPLSYVADARVTRICSLTR